MSEIKKRRKTIELDGNSRSVYKIDPALFVKDSGIIKLPNPKGKNLNMGSNWQDITLSDCVWPWFPGPIYKTIRDLGLFAFVCKVEGIGYFDPENPEKSEQYVENRVFICESGSALIARDEDGDGSIKLSPDSGRCALIVFYEGAYEMIDYDGKAIEGDESIVDESHPFVDAFEWNEDVTHGGIDISHTDGVGLFLLECYLKDAKRA